MKEIMAPEIPYADGLTYETYEAGPIDLDDILLILEKAPRTDVATAFNMRFFTNRAPVEGSSARIKVDRSEKSLGLYHIMMPPQTENKLEEDIGGLRIAALDLAYPGFNGIDQDFQFGSEALDVVRKNLEVLQSKGYFLDLSSFALNHHIVKTPKNTKDSFAKNYAARLRIKTAEMGAGTEKRKLVLDVARDMVSTRESDIYRTILEQIRTHPNTRLF